MVAPNEGLSRAEQAAIDHQLDKVAGKKRAAEEDEEGVEYKYMGENTFKERPKARKSQEQLDAYQEEISKARDQAHQASSPTHQPTIKVHPLLRELRQEFGLESVQTHDEKINDKVFTLRPPGKDLIGWANALAVKLCGGDPTDYNAKVQTTFAAVYVSHIDKTPIYEIFGFTKDEQKQAYSEFISFLLGPGKDELDTKIYQAYDYYIEPNLKVLSDLDMLKADFAQFKCPAEGCVHTLMEKKGGSYHCYLHGDKLVSVEVESDLPLS